ncbi:dihydroorotate dehydrogenase [Allopseudospirillum japonicum]|uniref:Dihydroorotate dehydrogenase (quinone) n=1 Tax=Allopseudospirillum japonicum TaxID=64971 RepID=A0A1H6T7A1_9GAMM|nr:quinone-dependent dihydroorotate dehydrogenase [Allopseudospirillum japonicum]SEI75918.1 dihydroorotate dehydrogenase [Allopseudospirillum japonicum]
MYSLARKAFFRLPPENAHEIALNMLNRLHKLHLAALMAAPKVEAPVQVMGLNFSNPVGLAAGLDKNATYLDALGALGFGFVEVGTVTPKAQAGNPKPRLFRVESKEVIINRMGFNNEGVDALVPRVAASRFAGIKGVNIGKNLTTSVEDAAQDYLTALEAVYQVADYVTVNISSPNTPGLRTLQYGETLEALLKPLKQRQQALADQYGKYTPIAVKIAPDMTAEEIRLVAASIRQQKMDAVIATNTTLDHSSVAGLPHADEQGGLSGAPLAQASTQVIAQLADVLEGDLPIIGVGGIHNAETALDKLKAGASLIQVYTGLIYRGPELIAEVAHACADYLQAAKASS